MQIKRILAVWSRAVHERRIRALRVFNRMRAFQLRI